jgi:hypothetical protein
MQSLNDWNELTMSALLHMSENKQRDHIHLGDVGRSTHGKYDVGAQFFSHVTLDFCLVGCVFYLLCTDALSRCRCIWYLLYRLVNLQI